jgi:nucleoside-diphosphate-sugar epimerase
MLAMESQVAVGEPFNVASGRATSIIELSKIIKNLLQAGTIEDNFAPSRTGDMKLGLASIDKIKGVLGYSPKIGMREGLEQVIDSMEKPQVARLRTGEAA